jgi:iron complex transport system substrate-binding protein
MKRFRGYHWRLVAVCATVLGLAVAPATVRADSTPTHGQLVSAANHALAFLATQQQPDGSLENFASLTEDWILGTVASGNDPNDLVAPSGKSAFDFLVADIADATSDANRTGKLIQTVVAAGRDPRSFAGQNLLAMEEGPGATAGGFYDPATGAFNTGVNATFHQSNAILGLTAAHDPQFPVTPQAIAFLKSLQATTDPGAGGWRASPEHGTNTNSTAMALMALASVNDHSADAAALAFLHTQQDPSHGGFPLSTLGQFGNPNSDPDSDALVIQALVAANQDPGSPVWTNAGGNALSDILRFRDEATGGFFFLPGFAPDAFTTSFIPSGLLESPFPILSR